MTNAQRKTQRSLIVKQRKIQAAIDALLDVDEIADARGPLLDKLNSMADVAWMGICFSASKKRGKP